MKKLTFTFVVLCAMIIAACTQTTENETNGSKPLDTTKKDWWKEAVVYQIYPRSFKDSNGDGVGDIKGIIEKLDYVKSLGIDMVWLNPVYASPNKDNGYDISDYQNIMKEFGTMQDFDALLKGFQDRNIKVMMDLVVNHCSDQHEWFRQARSSRSSPYYNYFHWWAAEKGKPPVRWSHFDPQADAWQYNKATNSYYLHYFADSQPDLNWENPILRQEIYKMMRFWLDKGIDGFRLDAIAYCSKDTTWQPLPQKYNGKWAYYYAEGPQLHNYMQEMNREVLSKYKVATVAEALGTVEGVLKFVDASRNELNMAYSFEAIDHGYLPDRYKTPDPKGWDLVQWKKIYAKWTNGFAQKGWGTIYLGNHDQPRMLTRWGNDAPEFRAIASKMLTTFILTMRGTAYYYYGDEIGMNNIKFDKAEDYNDIEMQTNYQQVKDKGGDLEGFLEAMKITSRDNGRTPMQWNTTTSAGFSTNPKTWLKTNPNYVQINAEAQEKDPNSILNYFRAMVQMRKTTPALIHGDWALVDAENPNIFAYTRTLDSKKILILLNFTKNAAAVNIGDLNIQASKILMNNYPDFDKKMILKPYQAVVMQL
jgi:oligo-1,6-glucosidase